jgi:predicted membrane-bound spermidine synthase
MRRFYAFFFLSGFCSLLYELIWLRLAVAQFGVTTTLVASFLSVFMAGLGLGSWLAGRLIRKYEPRLKFSPLYIYAIIELLIGISAMLVPLELGWGHSLLLRAASQVSLSSVTYYLLSGGWLFLALVPWCACMGATFPAAMAALNVARKRESRSFSFLYLANVLGAMAGAVLPLLLIERLGFSHTLKVGALLNLIVFTSAWLSARKPEFTPRASSQTAAAVPNGSTRRRSSAERWLLFGTGLTSMGLEVVWVRMFTPALGTVVYSFATILGIYLLATFLGTRFYRRWGGREISSSVIWSLLGFAGLLPLVASDPAVHISAVARVLLGIGPLALAAGFATPMLVDRDSGGDPEIAGSAYAMNVLGCVVGPLIAGYVLLPLMSERLALVTFSAPWFVIGMVSSLDKASRSRSKERARLWPSMALLVAGVLLFVFTKGFERRIHAPVVLRDPTATVIATGTGRNKHLLVNGIGMSALTPITKMMAHLPLAFEANPRNALVICFGMGTTHRSMLSWGIDSTVVELVPSVPKLFPYFHADAEEVLRSQGSHVIIDDGRHYMEWSHDQYDVIVIDPPPPVEAAGSSLLYSREFYAIARRHLRPGGILQQWFPSADPATQAGIARAIRESFPYVRTFHSIENWGVHLLAGTQPISALSGAELASHLPEKASRDLLEWGPKATAQEQFDAVLHNEFPIEELESKSPATPALRDDLPINEYYLLRRAVGTAK